MRAWIASPGHRAIILDRDFRDVGVGVTAGLTDGSAGLGAHGRLGLRLPHLVAYAPAMALGDSVREGCAADRARRALGAHRPRSARRARPGAGHQLDPQRHYLEGPAPDVAAYLLALDAINFGSGWFPTLSKRPGCSGYFTVAWAPRRPLARRRSVDRRAAARDARRRGGRHARPEPRPRADGLYAQALRELGRFLGEHRALDVVALAGGSAQRFAELLAGA